MWQGLNVALMFSFDKYRINGNLDNSEYLKFFGVHISFSWPISRYQVVVGSYQIHFGISSQQKIEYHISCHQPTPKVNI